MSEDDRVAARVSVSYTPPRDRSGPDLFSL